ncbi:MAG: 5-(carboxyamino)imidazole ribonucleotide mutase [Chloroflexi bacterium]|nr:5-(carboxyamino)imidazole ribonucleotide mutase [Chloroflexota bacterium]
MGSKTDMETMKHAVEILEQFGITHEVRVMSAHRTPDLVTEYASSAADRGIEVIIAAAGGAAALPGVVAAKTALPVIGVPMQTQVMGGMDSLLSMVQMPRGVPVATVAIGNSGATNSALLAAQIIGLKHPEVQKKFIEYRDAARRAIEEGR